MAGRPQRDGSDPARPRSILYRLTPVVRALFIAQSALFLFYLFVKPAQLLLRAHVALGPGFFSGELWQPVTSLLVHTPVAMAGALGFVFNMVGLWFFGPVIENTEGKWRFLLLFFVSGVVANLAMTVTPGFVAGAPWDGCGYAVLALVVAFGRIFDRTEAQIFGALFLRARVLAIIFVAWALLANLLYGNWPGVVGTMVASGVAWLLAGTRLTGLWSRLRRWRVRRRYQVLEGGRSDAKKPLPN